MTYFKQVQITTPLSDLAGITFYGELRTIEPVRVAGASFTGTVVDPNFWVPTSTGSGSVSQGSGEMVLDTGTTANSSAQCVTVKVARFVTACQMRFLGRVQTGDAGTVNNVRRWGAFTGTDGCYFKLADTTFYVCTMVNGVETAVPSSAWSQIQDVPPLTNMNLYEIYYTPGSVVYLINTSAVHAVTFPLAPWTSTYHLQVFMDNTNSGGLVSDLTMTARECTITRLGRFETQPIFGHVTGATTTVLKYGPGLLHRLVIGGPGGSKLTLYDNTAGSGIVITSISTPSQANPFMLEFDVVFSTGLTVVSTGTWDATIVYE